MPPKNQAVSAAKESQSKQPRPIQPDRQLSVNTSFTHYQPPSYDELRRERDNLVHILADRDRQLRTFHEETTRVPVLLVEHCVTLLDMLQAALVDRTDRVLNDTELRSSKRYHLSAKVYDKQSLTDSQQTHRRLKSAERSMEDLKAKITQDDLTSLHEITADLEKILQPWLILRSNFYHKPAATSS